MIVNGEIANYDKSRGKRWMKSVYGTCVDVFFQLSGSHMIQSFQIREGDVAPAYSDALTNNKDTEDWQVVKGTHNVVEVLDVWALL